MLCRRGDARASDDVAIRTVPALLAMAPPRGWIRVFATPCCWGGERVEPPPSSTEELCVQSPAKGLSALKFRVASVKAVRAVLLLPGELLQTPSSSKHLQASNTFKPSNTFKRAQRPLRFDVSRVRVAPRGRPSRVVTPSAMEILRRADRVPQARAALTHDRRPNVCDTAAQGSRAWRRNPDARSARISAVLRRDDEPR